MSASKKDRRSNRVPALHRLILSIVGPSGAEIQKEIVTTVEISRHGARVRGRRTLQPNWRGNFVALSSGRQVPIRIAWQVKPTPEADYFESGVEILADYNFWGREFSPGDQTPVPEAAVIERTTISPEELLQEMRKSSAFQADENDKLLEAVWCGLVEQLEERNVITRKELAASIRKISQRINKEEG